jgi:hypothetical protein
MGEWRYKSIILDLGNRWETAPSIHWIGGCICPTAGLDAMEKRKISCSFQESKPYSSAAQPVA